MNPKKRLEELVHNHGPQQGPGLDCPEDMVFGRLRGSCLKDLQVCKREGVWRVYDRGIWADSFDTLEDAHTFATQCAVVNAIFEPGALIALKQRLSR